MRKGAPFPLCGNASNLRDRVKIKPIDPMTHLVSGSVQSRSYLDKRAQPCPFRPQAHHSASPLHLARHRTTLENTSRCKIVIVNIALILFEYLYRPQLGFQHTFLIKLNYAMCSSFHFIAYVFEIRPSSSVVHLNLEPGWSSLNLGPRPSPK